MSQFNQIPKCNKSTIGYDPIKGDSLISKFKVKYKNEILRFFIKPIFINWQKFRDSVKHSVNSL